MTNVLLDLLKKDSDKVSEAVIDTSDVPESFKRAIEEYKNGELLESIDLD